MMIIFEDIYIAQDRYAANALQSQLHVVKQKCPQFASERVQPNV